MLVQHRLHPLVARRGHFEESRHTVFAAPVHAVQHQAVQVDVQVGGRAEALNERDRAAVGLVGLETDLHHQAVQRGLVRAVAIVVDPGTIRLQLGLLASGLHARLPRW